MNDQFELLLQLTTPAQKKQIDARHNYYRSRIKEWIHDAFVYRHAKHTTGWSMVMQGYVFALCLYQDRELSQSSHNRYAKFNERLKRLDEKEG